MASTQDLTISVTITQQELQLDNVSPANPPQDTMDVSITQPGLVLNEVPAQQISQTYLIIFGRWMKGDSWDNDFDIATNEDIDALFSE